MTIWQRPISLEILNTMMTSIESFIGFQFTDYGDDFIEGQFTVSTQSVQPFGILHGGISCVIAELMGSVASNLCIPDDQKAVGMTLTAHHLKAMPLGTKITAKAIPLRLGRRSHVWTITLHNESSQLCSQISFCVSILTDPN